jgi:hypothetical protein
MPRKVAISNLNASTIDILNVIRANASKEYMDLVPRVETERDIIKVGDVLFGYPALANTFLNGLINRIALVKAKSSIFNNPYKHLKKGYLENGETIEEVFVNIAKAREFSAEKAEQRELKRTLPDVRTALHAMNFRVQYPITIQQEDLRQAFLSMDGVQDLITKIIDAVYTAAEYDEYLLFKYLIIKAVSHGKTYPVSIGTDIKEAAIQFRGVSNNITFLKTEYNNAGVHTSTPKDDQIIFMDSFFNAQYDVNVLSAAFNMDKADFMGRLHLIDDFTTFDNARFDEIRANSTQIEEVTAAELALMQDVKAVLVDEEFFQVYDILFTMTETPVASGVYWNYFLNVWKVVSTSPFSNAISFVEEVPAMPAEITAKITDVSIGDEATTVVVTVDDTAKLNGGVITHIQTQQAVTAGVGVQKYGAYLIPDGASVTGLTIVVNGTQYTAADAVISDGSQVGETITFTKV